MKKIIFKIVCVCLVVVFAISASGVENHDMAKAYSWYCVRNKNNMMPKIAPELSFIKQYDGFWIDNSLSDDSEERIVYLTFDAGYENGNVERILDVLKEKKVSAAFFILKNLIERNPELVMRMAEERHTVCNHTANHKDMTNVRESDAFLAELEALSDAYENLTGKCMAKYYRPPEGRFSAENLKTAQAFGYKTVFWSFAYADWDNNNQMSPQRAKEKILKNIHNGAVLLLHPTSKTNADILGDIIDELHSQGYSFGTLDELTSRASVG